MTQGGLYRPIFTELSPVYSQQQWQTLYRVNNQVATAVSCIHRLALGRGDTSARHIGFSS